MGRPARIRKAATLVATPVIFCAIAILVAAPAGCDAKRPATTHGRCPGKNGRRWTSANAKRSRHFPTTPPKAFASAIKRSINASRPAICRRLRRRRRALLTAGFLSDSRAIDQSQNCNGARPRDPGISPRPRRRGDQVANARLRPRQASRAQRAPTRLSIARSE
jgi:hypothetical protein